jgi:hypothetical protein
MSYRPEDLVGLLETTLADLPNQEIQYVLDHNEYFWCSLFQNDAVSIDGGTSIQRKVEFDTAGTARYCGVFETDEYKFKDDIHTIDVHWAKLTASATWDEWEIVQQKNSKKGFINLVQTRRDQMYIDLADLIEETMITAPNSATDKSTPYTLPYYLRFRTAAADTINTSAGAWNGKAVKFGDGTWSTVCAGIDSTTEEKWRNWCGLYTDVNNAMLKSMRKALIKTKVKYPTFLNSPLIKERASKLRAVAPTDIVLSLMELVDKKDDAHDSTAKEVLGGMLVVDDGLVKVNKIPILPLDTLDQSDGTPIAYSPVYFMDLAYFKPFVHDGYWQKVDPPTSLKPLQHTAFGMNIDGAHNILVENIRRCGFVLHKAA